MTAKDKPDEPDEPDEAFLNRLDALPDLSRVSTGDMIRLEAWLKSAPAASKRRKRLAAEYEKMSALLNAIVGPALRHIKDFSDKYAAPVMNALRDEDDPEKFYINWQAARYNVPQWVMENGDYRDFLRYCRGAIAREKRLSRVEGKGGGKCETQPADTRSGGAKALALLVQHGDWDDTKIAKHVPCARTTLYDWPQYVAAREVQKKNKKRFPQGSKDGETKNIEAWKNEK